MGITVEELEKLITQLSQEQLREFRVWYEKFDSDTWDEHLSRKQLKRGINKERLPQF